MTTTFKCFTTDAEADTLRRHCEAIGASPTVVTELLNAVEEARCLDEMLRLFARGLCRPTIVGGSLRWSLSDAAKIEVAETMAAAALREVVP